MSEQFPVVSHGGRPAQIATCACGVQAVNYAHNGRAGIEVVARKFQRAGWNVDIRHGHHKCPACVEVEIKQKRMEKQGEGGAAMTKQDATVKLPPSEDSVLAKQMMMETLVDAYDLKARDYRPGWDDQKIAEKCKLSVEFVRRRREEDFGPVAPPKPDPMVEIAKRTEALSAALKPVSDEVERIYGATTNLRGSCARVVEAVNELTAQIKKTSISVAAAEKTS